MEKPIIERLFPVPRDSGLRMDGYFVWGASIINVDEDVFPEGRLEDPDLFLMDGQYHMVMEDNEGLLTGAERHGGHLVSAKGVRWRKHDPVKVYTHTIIWDDGGETVAKRRERPELFNANTQVKGRGEPTHLITAVLIDEHTRCVVQPIAPARQGQTRG